MPFYPDPTLDKKPSSNPENFNWNNYEEAPSNSPQKFSDNNPYAPLVAPNPFGSAGESINNFGASVGNFAGTVGNFLSEGVLKPIAKAAVSIPVTAYKDLQAIGKGVGSAASLIYNNPSVLWDKSKDNVQYNIPYSNKDINKEGTTPVEVPWLGNVNLNRTNPNDKYSDQYGMLDVPRTLMTQGAAGGEAALAASTVLNPATSIPKMALTGGGQAALHEAQNPESTIGSVGTAGVVAAGTSAVLGGFMNKLFGNNVWSGKAKDWETAVEKEAAKINLKPDVVERLKKLKPEGKAQQKSYIDQAIAYSKDPDNSLSPMEHLADRVTSGMKKLNVIKKEKGAGIGQIKGDIITGQTKAAPINVQELRTEFLSKLATKGVTVGNSGKLNFKASTLIDLSDDQKALNNLWGAIRKKGYITATEGLVLRERLQNNLYSGKARGDISASEKFLTDFEQALTEKIHTENPDLGELDSVFSELTKAVKSFKKKTKGTTQLTDDEALDGTNTFNLLRRSLGAGNKENMNILTKLQKLGEKYGIDELKDILPNRRLAQTAEDVVGVDINARPTSFAGRAAHAGKAVMAAAKLDPKKVMEEVGELAASPSKQADVLKGLLNEKPSATQVEKIVAHPGVRTLLENIQRSGGQVTAQSLVDLIRPLFN